MLSKILAAALLLGACAPQSPQASSTHDVASDVPVAGSAPTGAVYLYWVEGSRLVRTLCPTGLRFDRIVCTQARQEADLSTVLTEMTAFLNANLAANDTAVADLNVRIDQIDRQLLELLSSDADPETLTTLNLNIDAIERDLATHDANLREMELELRRIEQRLAAAPSQDLLLERANLQGHRATLRHESILLLERRNQLRAAFVEASGNAASTSTLQNLTIRQAELATALATKQAAADASLLGLAAWSDFLTQLERTDFVTEIFVDSAAFEAERRFVVRLGRFFDPNAGPLLEAGPAHTCLAYQGRVTCWGENDYGQTAPQELAGVNALFPGDNVTCARTDTAVRCWGRRSEINGLIRLDAVANAPESFHGFSAARWINRLDADGREYLTQGCAAAYDFVLCDQGMAPNMADVTELKTGPYYACAIASGKVRCWNTIPEQALRPSPILTNARSLAIGSNHTCALDDFGAHCWGTDGMAIDDTPLVTVPPLTRPWKIVAGFGFNCALDESPQGIKCWGLAHGATIHPDNPVVDHIPEFSGRPLQITAGNSHVCVLDNDGVKCWGSTLSGRSTVPFELQHLD